MNTSAEDISKKSSKSDAEIECLEAFYKLTVKQRDAAWREIEFLQNVIHQLQDSLENIK